ncbi:MAG: SseB family protein [Oscillospiraceae bacterium]|nr:SseB family protein [Oscillospiraceae bacterium]
MTVNELMRDAEMLYAAWFPGTKRHYLTEEDGALCAVIFPEQADLDRYALRKKEEGIRVDAKESPKEERYLLLTDFWRCGITKVRIEGSEPVTVALSELFSPPDYSQVPPEKRPIPDPALTGSVFRLLQHTVCGTADSAMLTDTLGRIRKAQLFGPVLDREDGSMSLPVIRQEGKLLSLLFTDTREFGLAFEGQDVTTKRFEFSDILWLLGHNSDAVAINIGSGMPLLIDMALLQAAGFAG